MGKILVHAIRKPPPPPNRGRGRPAGSNMDPTVKFIQTLSARDYSDLAEAALERGCSVQQYIRIFVMQAWRNNRE